MRKSEWFMNRKWVSKNTISSHDIAKETEFCQTYKFESTLRRSIFVKFLLFFANFFLLAMCNGTTIVYVPSGMCLTESFLPYYDSLNV